MVLHLAHHKSYHPYKAENIEKVRRDEERARLEEEEGHQRTLQADSEARLTFLRKRARKEVDQGEKALEKQLKGKSDEIENRATIIRVPESSVPTSIESNGHINFWADMERGVIPTKSRSHTNPEYEAEKKREADKWEAQITMSLGGPLKDLKPWYADAELKSVGERNRTQEQSLDAAFKDTENKRLSDPLSLMTSYLKRREEVRLAQSRDPWLSTPNPRLTQPVEPAILRPRPRERERERELKRQREMEEDVDSFRPAPPPPVNVPHRNVQTEAQIREANEKARAAAFIASRRKSGTSTVASTPMSEKWSYGDQFEKEATKAAHDRRSWAPRVDERNRHRNRYWDDDGRRR